MGLWQVAVKDLKPENFLFQTQEGWGFETVRGACWVFKVAPLGWDPCSGFERQYKGHTRN